MAASAHSLIFSAGSNRKSLLAGILLLALCPAAAQASSIFNNIASLCSPYSQKQPDCGYYPVFGPKGDPAVKFSDSAAAQFTPETSALATDARVTVVQNAPGPSYPSSGPLTVAIYSDANGLPGKRIGQAAAATAPYCCNAATVTASFPEPVSLEAGVAYWLVVASGATNTYVAWVVGGTAPAPVAQTLSSPDAQQCGWCAYGPSAVQFAIDSNPKAIPLTVVDPYLMTIPSNHQISASAAVSASAAGKAAAKGIVSDETSAAIVIYETTSSKAVTLSASNGAKLVKYAPGFLTAPPGAGAASLAVTPEKIGADYYALALVTAAAAPDAESGTNTTISAQSAGSSTHSTYSLQLIPTPIVLLHGLWGNLTSLAKTEAYLQDLPAFKNQQSLVTPVCYSVYLAFDAAADTIPGHGAGCEVTSAQALGQYFAALAKELDSKHYVGGRADVVAHSMGGLAVRHYAAISGYKSVRNRFVGAFRNVITLDTPETGSLLATYLDNSASRTLQVTNHLSYPFILWEAVCGSSTTITVEQCFYQNNLPLAYQGMALSTGAVASLRPTSQSIASAPPADTFNTAHCKWFAVSSDYPATDSPHALLRDVLDNITAATYVSGAPTVDQTLGSAQNDVVVTVSSQTATAVPAQEKQFKDLQHTPAPPHALELFDSDANPSVVTSTAVNGQVAFWLGLQKTPTPVAATPAAAELSADAGSGVGLSHVKPRFFVPERLAATLPSEPVALGQPMRIPLHFAGAEPAEVFVTQIGPSGRELVNEAGGAAVGSGRIPILHEVRGPAIEVTPLATGAVRLRIAAIFADGGLARQEYELNVAPSSRGLESFELNRGFRTLPLVLEDNEEDRQAYLFPRLKYAGLNHPIYLDNSEALRLTVDQPEDDPVIEVEPSGLIRALRPGRATVTGDFDGVKDSVRVTVYPAESAPESYRRSSD